VRRVIGVWLVYYAWTESMYIPIFFDTFLYARGKDPLDSCSWTNIWDQFAIDLRATLAWY
jgi:hypothetical protein